MLGVLGDLALCYRNDLCRTRHRVEWMLTARFSVPLAVVVVATDELGNAFASKFEICSNEFCTEFALNLDLKSVRYRRGLS